MADLLQLDSGTFRWACSLRSLTVLVLRPADPLSLLPGFNTFSTDPYCYWCYCCSMQASSRILITHTGTKHTGSRSGAYFCFPRTPRGVEQLDHGLDGCLKINGKGRYSVYLNAVAWMQGRHSQKLITKKLWKSSCHIILFIYSVHRERKDLESRSHGTVTHMTWRAVLLAGGWGRVGSWGERSRVPSSKSA